MNAIWRPTAESDIRARAYDGHMPDWLIGQRFAEETHNFIKQRHLQIHNQSRLRFWIRMLLLKVADRIHEIEQWLDGR